MSSDINIPDHWQLATINDIQANEKRATITGPFGSSIGKRFFVSEGIPVIRGNNLSYKVGTFDDSGFVYITREKANELKGYIAKPGDLIFTAAGTIGQVALIPFAARFEEYIISNKQMRVRLDLEKVDTFYAYYWFSCPMMNAYIKRQDTGSTIPLINLSVLRALPIPLPPLQEQRTIATILKSLDDKIGINHQINQTLEQMAQAIFKSWFVDFEPVKAKIAALEAGGSEEDALLAAMQAISGKGEDELTRLQAEQPEQYAELRATAELFPSAMQDSELGKIPEGWGARPFGELLEKTIGGDWGKEEPDEKHTERVKILRGTDLPDVYAGDDRKVPTRYVDPKKLTTRRLKPGDIVIEVSGGSKGQPTGRSLFFTSRLLKRLGICEPASFCRLFRPKGQETGLFLGLYLQHIYAEGKTWLYQNQSTGISNFQTKIFLEHELVATPPEQVTYSFYERTIPLISQIHSDENTILAEIRDSLLPKLLSGELSVFDAEGQLTEVTESANV